MIAWAAVDLAEAAFVGLGLGVGLVVGLGVWRVIRARMDDTDRPRGRHEKD